MGLGLPWWLTGKEYACQAGDDGVEKLFWWREWQPTPAFLPGESHGQRSLVGYSPWGHKESDTTEWLSNNNRGFKRLFLKFPQDWSSTLKLSAQRPARPPLTDAVSAYENCHLCSLPASNSEPWRSTSAMQLMPMASALHCLIPHVLTTSRAPMPGARPGFLLAWQLQTWPASASWVGLISDLTSFSLSSL